MAFLQLILHNILSFVVIISVIVFIHEFGHFLVARMCGVKIDEFAIGFGRELIGFTDKGGTRWKICPIPFGGYVKMFGDKNGASIPDDELLAQMSVGEKKISFLGKTVWQRMAIVVAGPVANFLLTIFIFTFLFRINGLNTVLPIVDVIAENSAAAESGLKKGDRILAIDGKEIFSFDDIREVVTRSSGKELGLRVLRSDSELSGPRNECGVTQKESSSVTPKESSSVTQKKSSSVIQKENSSATQKKSSSVIQKENSLVTPNESSSVTQKESSSVTPKESSSVTQKKSSSVIQKENSLVTPNESSSVTQKESSSVTPKESSSATQKKSSSVIQKKSSSVIQKENSLVTPNESLSPRTRCGVGAGEEVIELLVTPKIQTTQNFFGEEVRVGMLGISASESTHEDLNLGQSFLAANKETYKISIAVFKAIGELITGQRSIDELSGPIKMAKYSGKTVEMGAIAVLWFAAMISLNLGVMNLLPIPVLDGGHLFFYLIEAIRGKPLAQKTQQVSFKFGLSLVLALMLFTTFNDVRQIVGGM